MVAKTQFAITGEDTRYFLNGALFVLRPDSMSLVATDGHRLALVTAPRDGKAAKDEDEVEAILPKKTLGELGASAHRRRRRHPLRARREPPVLRSRRPAAHLADDRRAVSGLRARDSEGQRQAHRVRARSADERRQARGAAVERAIARREVSDRQGQGRRHVEQPGTRRGARKRCRSTTAAASMQICFNAQYVLDFLVGGRRPTSSRSS